ncbi:AcrR family transcriptional regulator [Thermocatellispora tengchongensis]|uniref:AcrR family transcriptional regulator n=1 Tax=Thermocatellispora tengchongensis TaxID=1073253 RepID=A0A840P957_9ACTN|nr:TetR/AcrR family transcriptional regulator [Thermocatellispora tengchongensis]MBB5134443.1 AcrR family transcriptional regulator [Thermocatellispora tengchongensis]
MTTPVRAARTGRRGRPGYDRESLLEVAVAVFNERGYDGTGMEELAKRLGITKSAIYHHVSGKDELLELAVSRALDALFAVLDDENAAGSSATERLERTVRRAVHVLARELPYVTLLLRVRGNSAVERRALERRREFDHRVADLVARAAAEGGVRDDIDPRLTSRLLFGTVNSLIEWYRPGGDLSPAALADALATILFDGLRAAPPAGA